MAYPFFSKYQQAGNDFVIFDDRLATFPVNDQAFINQICHRKFGIGADGVILLQASKNFDFCMRIFNSDGKEAESCGNGICCLAKFIKDHNLTKSKEISFELMKSIVKISYDEQGILVKMGDPSHFKPNQKISLEELTLTYHFIDTGVPHFVAFDENVEKIDLKKLGSHIRNHINFAPHGTNVNFAAIKSEHEIIVRTYERGVENETLACGTGACAVALIASFVYNLSSPIKICHPGGKLIVYFKKNQLGFRDVSIADMSKEIYSGCLSMKFNDGDARC